MNRSRLDSSMAVNLLLTFGMSTPSKYKRLNTAQAALLLIDHQAGLMSLVRDSSPAEFKSCILALADLARYLKLPTVLTTSFEEGPNGPILPELKEIFPDAPLIARPGQINAWDNDDFVTAVENTGRKQLIVAGVVTDVCVAFPTLSALSAGYEVFVAVDASGTFSQSVRDAAWIRMTTAGAQLMNWFSIASELQRDWRMDVEGFGHLLSKHLPEYQNLTTGYLAKRKKVAA